MPKAPVQRRIQPPERKTSRVGVNFTPSDMEVIAAAAKRDDFTTVASWLAAVGLAEARRPRAA
jgi:hypothetical protein